MAKGKEVRGFGVGWGGGDTKTGQGRKGGDFRLVAVLLGGLLDDSSFVCFALL